MEPELTIRPPGKPEVEETPTGENATGAKKITGLLGGGPSEPLEVPAQVDESVVRGLLKSIGSGTSYLAGDDDVPNHWCFTERELNDLTPALTRIINRREQLRRAVVRGDEMTVAVVLAGYLGRNTADAKKARDKRNENESGETASATRTVGSPSQGSGAQRAAFGNGRNGDGVSGAANK